MKDPQWYVFEPSVATMLPCKTNVREQKIVIEFNGNATNKNCCASFIFIKNKPLFDSLCSIIGNFLLRTVAN